MGGTCFYDFIQLKRLLCWKYSLQKTRRVPGIIDVSLPTLSDLKTRLKLLITSLLLGYPKCYLHHSAVLSCSTPSLRWTNCPPNLKPPFEQIIYDGVPSRRVRQHNKTPHFPPGFLPSFQPPIVGSFFTRQISSSCLPPSLFFSSAVSLISFAVCSNFGINVVTDPNSFAPPEIFHTHHYHKNLTVVLKRLHVLINLTYVALRHSITQDRHAIRPRTRLFCQKFPRLLPPLSQT